MAYTYQRLYGIEYVDDGVFFKIEDMEASPEDDIGWRSAYRQVSTRVYYKKTDMPDTKLLYLY